MTYKIVRMYKGDKSRRVIETGLTLEQAQAHCADSESSSSTCTQYVNRRRTVRYGEWMDGYDEEKS